MNEDMLRKVRGLLAVAEDPATPEEARDAYVAKAQSLMMLHAIDEAMIAAKPGATSTPETRQIIIDGQYQRQKVTLFGVVAKASGVKCVYTTFNSRAHMTCIGYPEDIDVTETLFTSLLIQMTNQAMKQKPVDAAHGAETVSWRKSFMHGFCLEVSRRLAKSVETVRAEAAETHGQSVGLVLASREQSVEKAFKEKYPRVRTVRSTIGNSAGYASGRTAGQKADVGSTRIGGRLALNK